MILHFADVFASMFPDQDFLKHTNEEDEFRHLKDGEIIMEIINPHPDHSNLYVFTRSAVLTLIYGDWSSHFMTDDESVEHMLQVIESILENRSFLLRITTQEDSVDFLVYSNRILFSCAADKALMELYNNRPFMQALSEHTCRISKSYWK